MAHKILVYWDITEEQKNQIQKLALRDQWDVFFTTDVRQAEEEAVDAEILFGSAISPLRAAKNPKWFCTHTAGVDAFLVPGVLPEKCLLTNSSGAYGVTIAEHIIMVSLMLMRNFRTYDEVMHQPVWRHDIPMRALHGSRITVLGTGDIGTTFATRVRSFEPASVTGVNRSGKKPSADYDRIVKQDDLSAVLPETDLLVMSLPETEETRGILSADRIALFPDTAYIVNVGRGSAIDEAALVRALNSGKLAGAALDVMQHEPLPADDPLRTAANILLTPHTAGQMTLGYTRQKSVDMFCEDLENYMNGRPLHYLVDRKAGY